MKKIWIAAALLVAGFAPQKSLAGYVTYSGTLGFMGTDWAVNRVIFAINGTTGPCPYGQFSIGDDNPNYQVTVAELMLAMALGKTVSTTTDATNSCPNSRANVINVNLFP